MFTRNNQNLSQRITIRYKQNFLSVDSRLNPSSFQNKKKNLLYSNKSSLMTLLNKIKNSQLNFISEKTYNKKVNISNTKQILSLLKDNLSSILKEKNKIYNFFKKENDKKKKKIQKLIFPDEEEEIYENNEEDGGYKLTIGNTKLYSSEINQLKILNFQIENEIKNTEFLSIRNLEKIINIKENPFYLSDENEIICTSNYNNISKTSNILHDYINKQRKKFIDTVNKKSDQDMELKALSMKSDYLKNILDENNKNIITEDIINECEESKNIVKNTEDSNYIDYLIRKSKSSKNNKNNLLKFMSNEKINKNIYFVNKEKNIRKKLIFSETVSPKIIYNIYSNKNILINNVNNDVNNNDIKDDDEDDENIVKSFNSSRDLETTLNQNNEINEDKNQNKINLEINEDNKNIGINNISNENSNTDNSNNKSNKKENNQISFGLELNEKGKQNEDAEYIFTMSNKE